ncbi:MAG: WG repeat-containing protein, partial [Clostridiales bacterium]|nr:WG repeat-containing protein [Clostridiales bacterium]
MGNSYKYGFIDKDGSFLIEPQFDGTHGFSEGLAPVLTGNDTYGKWGFIDLTGELV